MDPLTIGAIVTAGAGTTSTVMVAWLRQRGISQKAKERTRLDYLRHLPAGSHVVDLGARGIVIEIGSGMESDKDRANAIT